MILVDTTPLVALCYARDSRHRTAMKHVQGLARTGLGTCDAVLVEPVVISLIERSGSGFERCSMSCTSRRYPPRTTLGCGVRCSSGS